MDRVGRREGGRGGGGGWHTHTHTHTHQHTPTHTHTHGEEDGGDVEGCHADVEAVQHQPRDDGQPHRRDHVPAVTSPRIRDLPEPKQSRAAGIGRGVAGGDHGVREKNSRKSDSKKRAGWPSAWRRRRAAGGGRCSASRTRRRPCEAALSLFGREAGVLLFEQPAPPVSSVA